MRCLLLASALLLAALPASRADETTPRAPALQLRIVYVERMVRTEGGEKVTRLGEERSFRLDDPAWRKEPGAGADPQFVTCVESLARSLGPLVDPETLRFPPEVEERATRLAAKVPDGALAVALHLQRDVDLDATLDQIDAGSVRVKPQVVPGERVGADGKRTWGGSASIETVKPKDGAPARGPGVVKRQIRLFRADGTSRSLSSRALGSVENAAKADACAFTRAALVAALDDALARTP